jgi:quinoprotein glucose dehydrogenase
VIVVGAAHLEGGAPKSKTHEKGFIRGYDAKTGKRLWIFHTIPSPGEFGNDTWLKDSWAYTGNAGVWAQMTIDEETDTVFLPVELPTGDYFGGHRPGNGLFGESLVALDLKTGQTQVALPTGAPRHLGHGHSLCADPRGPGCRREAD